MTLLKKIFANSSVTKSPAAKLANKSKRHRTNRVTFESLEGRQMMSAATLSAVSFEQPRYETLRVGSFLERRVVGEVPTTAVFSIAANGSVSESTAPGYLTKLGGSFTQISAGLDANGNPEVYGIAPNGTISVNDGAGWVNIGANATQISASIDGTVYFTGADRSVWMHNASGFTPLYGQVTQISAGVNFAGQPEVYAVGYPSQSAFVNFGQGWVDLGGQVQQVAGAMNDTVYVIGIGNAVYVNHNTTIGGTGWQSLGGVVSQISAGLDAGGNDDVFAIGSPSTHAFVNDGNGWVDLNGSGIEIAAPAISVGVPNDSVAVLGLNGQTDVYGASGFYSLPTTLDAIETKYQALGGAANSGLGQPTGSEIVSASTGGSYQAYQNGRIYWSKATGAHEITGMVLQRYVQAGGPSGQGPAGALGYPTSDTFSVSGLLDLGTFNTFSGGAIYYSTGATKAYIVGGPTYRSWLSFGGASGAVVGSNGQLQGLPTGDTQTYANGQITYFQNVKAISSPGGVRIVPIATTSMTFSSSYLSTQDPVGGTAQLTVYSSGSYALSYNFNDTALGFFGEHIPYNYTVSFLLVSPTGNVFDFTHSYHIGSYDAGTITGLDPNLFAKWQDLQGCVARAGANAAFTIGGAVGELESEIANQGDYKSNVLGQAQSLYQGLGGPLQTLFWETGGFGDAAEVAI